MSHNSLSFNNESPTMRRTLSWSLLLILLVGMINAVPLAAQCSPREDWGVYTVRGGDTLSRIATRFGSSVDTLLEGNCLSSATIYSGQRLRVPGAPTPTASTPLELPASSSSVEATYLAFERGFMIWRNDTGAVYVFAEGGRVDLFPSGRYGALAQPRITDDIPAERYAPQFGMAQVWAGFPQGREALGWALSPQETSYTLHIQRDFGRQFLMSLPDNRLVLVTLDGVWQMLSGTLTPTPMGEVALTTGASYQEFERGYMLWREDTGAIWVYMGDPATYMPEFVAHLYGEVWVIAFDQYAALPVAADERPPRGRYLPSEGFGRVWSGIAGVRERLGWAITAELGYEMTLRSRVSGIPYEVTLPPGQGKLIQIDGARWGLGYLEALGLRPTPTPLPTATPTP
jgi:LysM repeat protein